MKIMTAIVSKRRPVVVNAPFGDRHKIGWPTPVRRKRFHGEKAVPTSGSTGILGVLRHRLLWFDTNSHAVMRIS
jgi:hypothetical protein